MSPLHCLTGRDEEKSLFQSCSCNPLLCLSVCLSVCLSLSLSLSVHIFLSILFTYVFGESQKNFLSVLSIFFISVICDELKKRLIFNMYECHYYKYEMCLETYDQDKLDHAMQKRAFGHTRTAQAKISLLICAV